MLGLELGKGRRAHHGMSVMLANRTVQYTLLKWYTALSYDNRTTGFSAPWCHRLLPLRTLKPLAYPPHQVPSRRPPRRPPATTSTRTACQPKAPPPQNHLITSAPNQFPSKGPKPHSICPRDGHHRPHHLVSSPRPPPSNNAEHPRDPSRRHTPSPRTASRVSRWLAHPTAPTAPLCRPAPQPAGPRANYMPRSPRPRPASAPVVSAI